MDKQKAYLQTLSEFYPALSLQNVHFHCKDGQYNDILIINNALIFRFPRYAEGIQNIQKEVRLLSQIQDYTTLPIPNPIYANTTGTALTTVFIGYQMLPGEPLWRDTLHNITDSQILDQLATQLAGFLKELHSIPIEKLEGDLPVNNSLADAKTLYTQVQTHLFPFMRSDARQAIKSHFETYFNTPHLHNYPLTLHHGDFGSSNILYTPDSQTISGIIDFGFAALGDPALDIAAASTYGESFLARFHDTYPEIEPMLERARFYRGTYALYEAWHGFKNNDSEAFEAGMAPYI